MKEKDIREKYEINFQSALSFALIFFIVIFSLIKNLEVKPYLPSSGKEIILENIEEEIELLEEPPPPPKPTLPIETVEEGEETEEELAPTTTFSELVEQPVLPEVKIYDFFEVEEAPIEIKRVKPEYPELARKLKIEGKVIVRMVVGPDGKVHSAEIVKSPHEVFNEPVLKAVYQWIFKPGKQLGQPVSVRVILPINFHLEKVK